jgi:uncharacterized damage-inducible protein DinB
MEKQPESIFIEFVHFNNWANQQVLAACQKLTDEQLDTVIPGAYGTIRKTMEHIIRAEAGYVRRLTGSRPEPSFDWKEKHSLAEVAKYAMQVGEALLDMAQKVSPDDMVADEDDNGKPISYQARLIFIQIIDHGIEHRTNITTILNQGMMEPPDVAGWAYLDSHPERFNKKNN